jgi:hypothetical protein
MSGIASQIALGSNILSSIKTITMSGITSHIAFGSHTLIPDIKILSPSGITSHIAFGNHIIIPGAKTITMSGITSHVSFGSHRIIPTTFLSPLGIISHVALGYHAFSSAVTLNISSVVPTLSFGTPILTTNQTTINIFSVPSTYHVSIPSFNFDHILNGKMKISINTISIMNITTRTGEINITQELL